ncbi:MAG: ABC transporter ATP-binding protein [Spirochaetes bacterium RBG_16_49_21]|nr:MAG: ABC transporter ATP-binding protein [Spirochaetes bacterium RBG_16_49_21]
MIEVEGLTKSFGGLTAIDNVYLKFKKRELSSIIGPNGAGKTTLFNLITGHLSPDQGKIIFNGRDITNLPPHEISRVGIGRSFQRQNIFPRLSTFENIQIALFSAKHINGKLFSQAKNMLRDETDEILESVGLTDKKLMQAGYLAYGDQKRLEIGIALAIEPQLLLLDEPTAGMSPRETIEITKLIKKLVKKRGLTLIFIEHDMDIVFGISEKVKVMHQGRIIFEGTPKQVKANAEVQKIYLGKDKK